MKQYKVFARYAPPTNELEDGGEILEIPEDLEENEVEDCIREYVMNYMDWSYEEI